MTRFEAFALAMSGLLATFLASPTVAQTAPDIVGEWHGVVAAPTGDMTLILYVTRGEDSALKAEIESREQAPGRKAPVTEVASADGHLAFTVPAIRATYEGTWDETRQQWRGTLAQSVDMPLNLSKGLPPPKPLVEGLDGVWEGTIESNDVKLRQVLRITSGEWGRPSISSS